MTLSGQLGALGRSKSTASESSRRVKKTVSVASPLDHVAEDKETSVPMPVESAKKGGSIRKKLSKLLKSTGDLSASIFDETASELVRNFSFRKKDRAHKRRSSFRAYADESLWSQDGDDDSISSRTGSLFSLTEEIAGNSSYPARPEFRRTHSFIETSHVNVHDQDEPRMRSASHAGVVNRRPWSGSGPSGQRGLRGPSRSREHLHSAWSSSLTSLQEGVIANDWCSSDSSRTFRGSADSLFPHSRHRIKSSGDDVDAVSPSSSTSRHKLGSLTGFHGPNWAFLCTGPTSGSLPSSLHQLLEDEHGSESRASKHHSTRSAQDTNWTSGDSGASTHVRLRKKGFVRAPQATLKHRRPSSLHDESTRSRSLTHIAALDMSGDAGRPDRLVVPPAADAPTLRRQKLARSQVSSSEYFSVTFDVLGPDAGPDEFIVATKGTSLAEALSGPCQQRSVDINSVSVYLEGIKTPLQPAITDTAWLGGKQLRIKAKEENKGTSGRAASRGLHQAPLRKTSGSVRSRSGRFFSTSTEDPSISNLAWQQAPDFLGLDPGKPKGSKQRWSGLFGNSKDTKMEALVEQLNNYSKHGFPRERPAPSDPDLDQEYLYLLEEDWRDLVEGSATLPERLQQQQTALWELLQTELAYIRTLTVVTDLFLECLSNLQEARILTDVDKTRLFSNVMEIQTCNARFWVGYLLPMLTFTRETRQPLNPHHMLEGFLKFDELFQPYVQYCADQSGCQKYCRERTQDNELFTAYLVWCETQGACNRLRLMDILVKPMQRLTKYSLLLKAIHKNTDCEDQRHNIEMMIRKVDEFVNGVNSSLRHRQDHERLKALIARIDAYDIVESKDDDLEKLVRQHSELDLTRPMPNCAPNQRRQLLLEGDLRLKDHSTSKMDVHCFLLTDMLLVCKTITKKSSSGEGRGGRFRVLRPPYVVERLVMQELQRDTPTLACVYLNEYLVATSAFLLSSPESKTIKLWADGVRKAQGLYSQAKHAALIAALGASTPPNAMLGHAPPLSLSRQPSSLYEEDMASGDGTHNEDHDGDSHSYASYSMGLYPLRSPRGSSRASSLNQSHSGSVEMNEASSLSSVSQSRGVSVDNNELRASSLSSDEGIPPLGADQSAARSLHASSVSPRADRRSMHSKTPSPNTLSIQVPVFSSLGQSLPNLNLAASSPHSGLQPPSSLLLVPPSGKGGGQHHGPLSPGHRGTSYPPPSPPRGSLRRGIALATSRNPPLLKTRHVCSVGVSTQSSCAGPWPTPTSSAAAAAAAGPGPAPGSHSPTASSGQVQSTTDYGVPVIAGVSPPKEKTNREGEEQLPQQERSLDHPGASPTATPVPNRQDGDQPSQQQQLRQVPRKRLTRTDKKSDGRTSWSYCSQGSTLKEPQDITLIDRATSPLCPPPSAGTLDRNPFGENASPGAVFQSPSLGSSPGPSGPRSSLAPSPSIGSSSSLGPSPVLAASPVGIPLASLSASPSLGTSPVGPVTELAPSNPFLDAVASQDLEVTIPKGNTNPFLELLEDQDTTIHVHTKTDHPAAAAAEQGDLTVLISDASADYTDA